MPKQLIVQRNRTNSVLIDIGFDVSQDVITSEIRKEMDWESDLLAPWVVSFATDGTDGLVLLTLDNSVTSLIDANVGYMDLKRRIGGETGEPVSVFLEPIQVLFKGTVTA